jgi:REP element-mobilizing transposase RayT
MEIELIEPDYYYHVFNRGINRQPIFTWEGHYRKFLMLCEKYIPQTADVLAYCLLPNHFHFLLYIHPDGVYPPRRGVNSPLGNLFNSYAQWFNRQTDRTGGLFQRPFKRKKITDQDYLKKVIYYIHRNPLHHKLTRNPANYTFSSYQEIIGHRPSFLQREQVLEWFDDRRNFIDYHSMQFEIDTELMLEDE